MILRRACRLGVFLFLSLAASLSGAQQIDTSLYAGMQWRMIGPFRGGRTVAISGIPNRPNVFYMAPNNGGVWKTTDAGRTWKPLFDSQPTGSIGSLAIAPSNPDVLYVGSGEGLQRPDLSVGDGIYRSADGGRTWEHLGLRDGQQIPAIVVDPRDPNRVFAAVLGHPYGPNAERGLYRSSDGGKSWQPILHRDENTGAVEVALDPSNPDTVYCVLWSARQAPWEIGDSWNVPGSGLFKSTDGGNTWTPLTQGLPQHHGRIGMAIAPSEPRRIYALVDAEAGGLYRSDDAGATWRMMDKDGRIWGRGGDFAEVRVDPANPDRVYVADTSTYRSEDGGKSFTAIKGAPGGDDYHRIWINPLHPEIIAIGCDQGATISVNGGETWSSWYNQPTAQFYHVSTDNRFPYWVFSGQQESGSAGVASRGDYGAITSRDWMTVGAEEYGYVVADPLDSNYLYGGKITRFDRRTGDVQDVSPEALRSGKYRFVRTQPIAFSPVDKHALYFAGNVVFKTRDGGRSWSVISPDLTRPMPAVPATVGVFRDQDPEKGGHRGVVYTLAPSPVEADTLWAGTDDGLIHVTRDGGKSWADVTPPALTAWSKVSVMDAGHFDASTAYAAINRFRLDDLHPHIYRTHDMGRTWTEIVDGIPANEVVNAVREDPVRRGLLYCSTERAVYFSIDDGAHWQSLRLNMPATSVRDIVVHGDDLVIGTHGRSFWILDDITPLRQIDGRTQEAKDLLFTPAFAYRMRRSRNTDTPLPPEEPMGQNPPDGAIIDYWLGAGAHHDVSIEILDHQGLLVRRYASDDRPVTVDPDQLDVPMYWARPPRTLSTATGMHRWVWDLRYTTAESAMWFLPMTALPHDTPPVPEGPLAEPGEYTVRLNVDGHTSTRPLNVVLDPRVTTPPQELEAQFSLTHRLYKAVQESARPLRILRQIRPQLDALSGKVQGDALASYQALRDRLAAFGGATPGGRRRRAAGGDGLDATRGACQQLMETIGGTDGAPTTQATAAAEQSLAAMTRLMAAWSEVERELVPALNKQLKAQGLTTVTMDARPEGKTGLSGGVDKDDE
jgi:photosystem II stability/assembly factor-like uncharacterized protein